MTKHGFKTQLPYGELTVSGDDEHGFRPYQLLVSSIAICSGGIFKQILQKRRISFQDIRIKADVTREETGARAVTDIHLHFTIIGTDASDEQIEKSLHITQRNCSMVQSVQNSIRITETFERK